MITAGDEEGSKNTHSSSVKPHKEALCHKGGAGRMLATLAKSSYPFQGYGQTERVMLGTPAMAFYPFRDTGRREHDGYSSNILPSHQGNKGEEG